MNSPAIAGGAERGGREETVVALSIAVEFMRFCPKCNEDTRFYAYEECATGLVGFCTRCGKKGIAQFTRTVPEVNP